MDEPKISAELADWAREKPDRWWDPSRALLRSIRDYQNAAGLLAPWRRKYAALRHIFWCTITGADKPDIHQLGNPDVSGQDLITIHVYAPPLGVLKTYKVGSSQVDLYTPNDFPT